MQEILDKLETIHKQIRANAEVVQKNQEASKIALANGDIQTVERLIEELRQINADYIRILARQADISHLLTQMIQEIDQ